MTTLQLFKLKTGNLTFFLIVIIFAALFWPQSVVAREPDFPPAYIYKLAPGDDFTSFSFNDLEGQLWTNKPFLSRPILFICGSFKLRHDVRKWADHLTLHYGTLADIIWLFNHSGTEFADHNDRAIKDLSEFRPSLPTVIDNHSLVGRSLQIDYRIPVLVGIDQKNRLAFTYSSPLNKQAREEIRGLIYSRLLNNSR